MNEFGAAFAWLTDPSHWQGAGSIPTRIAEHLGVTALAVVLAALVAIPLGVLIRHTRRGSGLMGAFTGAHRPQGTPRCTYYSGDPLTARGRLLRYPGSRSNNSKCRKGYRDESLASHSLGGSSTRFAGHSRWVAISYSPSCVDGDACRLRCRRRLRTLSLRRAEVARLRANARRSDSCNRSRAPPRTDSRSLSTSCRPTR